MASNSSTQLSTVSIPNNSFNQNGPIFVPDYILVGRYVAICITFGSAYVFASLLVYTMQNWNVRNASKVNHLPVACAFCSLMLSLMKCSEQWSGVFACSTYHWIETTIYVIGTVLTYTVLWARQRKLYSDERLKTYVSKPMRMASSVMIIIIYLTISGTSFLFATRYKFERDSYPCVLTWKPLETLYPVTITFMVACFLFQLILFFFLLYPLSQIRSVSSKRNCFFCFQSQTDAERTAKRLAACLGACISSSTLLSVTVLLDTFPSIKIHWCNFAALDLLTNTVATTCALVSWKKRLFSLFICNVQPQPVVSKSDASET